MQEKLWKRISGPLRKVNKEIIRMAENVTDPVSYTQDAEFDFVLSNFQKIKDQVNELIHTVTRNEKLKSQFEIEKLFSQINPHFLHNTLNTVQWLVRLNGQKEIDRLVTLLVSCTERACRSWRAKPFSILFSATHPFSRSTTLSLSGRRKAAI
ncbi:Histidine kinase [compost metagenome]